MGVNNIKRNELDYILTDILPTELSEQFTLRFFYDFLSSKLRDLDKIKELLFRQKGKQYEKLFLNKDENNSWISMPLKYLVMKNEKTEREISLVQPIAAMELFLFISCYQKEILALLEKNSVFSIRYHRRNNNLKYLCRKKSITKYFADVDAKQGRGIIEKTGMFFEIGPHQSITSFTSSGEWFVLNSKYHYFARVDYKSCFNSIYSHSFNQIIGKDVNDTNKFINSSVFAAMDRVLMNINARRSNGIPVGPEFSRMAAELLLQDIDTRVYDELLNDKKIIGEDYNVYRYVDDIFIFAKSEELVDEIITKISSNARKYSLELNEAKMFKSSVPFVLNDWFHATNDYIGKLIQLLFYSKEDQERIAERDKYLRDTDRIYKPHIVKSNWGLSKKNIMSNFNDIICEYPDKARTIVAYFLGVMINKVGNRKEETNIFREDISKKKVFEFLELSFFVYSYYPSYSNTQRLLAIISYVRDEVDIFKERAQLQELIQRYAFVFEKANLNDVINLLLFCRQAGVELPYRMEEKIVNRLTEKDDPILWASYLIYSRYNEEYYREIKDTIGKIITERLDSIQKKESIFIYREFWWLLLFNKCPDFEKGEIQKRINKIIKKLVVPSSSDKAKDNSKKDAERDAGKEMVTLFSEFLKTSDKQFFEWDIENKDFLREVTFKTRQRTVFKNYKENLNDLEWGSF